jgi:hypothetical protein
MRQQLLEAIYDGQPFRAVLRDLGVTSNQVSGLAKTDQEWSKKLETALTAARRNDLKHGTNAAYVHGCVLPRVPGAPEHQNGQDLGWLRQVGRVSTNEHHHPGRGANCGQPEPLG